MQKVTEFRNWCTELELPRKGRRRGDRGWRQASGGVIVNDNS